MLDINDQIISGAVRCDAALDYGQNGYAVVRGAAPAPVSNGLLGLITQGLARPDIAKRFLAKPSVNAAPAYEFHASAFPQLSGLHWGLTGMMIALTGQRLAPSYAYFRAYQKDDVCTIHTDRPACEHSMSLALGYSDNISWSFECGKTHYSLEETSALRCTPDFGEEDFTSLMLEPGDAVIYRGVNLRHGRVTQNPNRWSAHAFLHWVDLDGPFADWAFDRAAPPAPRGIIFGQP